MSAAGGDMGRACMGIVSHQQGFSGCHLNTFVGWRTGRQECLRDVTATEHCLKMPILSHMKYAAPE